MTSRTNAESQALVKQLLGEMAGRLEANRPNAPITTIGRHALLQATTMDPPVLRALREKAPDFEHTMVRREYATLLRQTADQITVPTAAIADVGVSTSELQARAADDYTRARARRAQLSHEDRVHGQEADTA